MTARPPWHAGHADEVPARLATGPHGLTRAEAAARLARDGPNQLPEPPPTRAWAVLLHQFRSPLIYILLVAGLVTLALQELIDTGAIALVIALNAVIGYTQERRAEASVRALMRLMAPQARVIRDGREWEIASRDLVAGDVVLLESGARVPADLRLWSTTALRVDESLLTGESLPVAKTTRALDSADAPVADRTNMAYTGTVVASGRGRGWVVATGLGTELGAIAESVRREAEPETPLQQRLGGFARAIGMAVATSAVLAFAIGVAMGEAPSHMFVAAVALAVSAVPEGLPAAFTITLALGVRRMARRHAIVRRLPAVETLGSTTIIGSDKTGTLTENRMTVRELRAAGHTVVLEGERPRDGVDVRAALVAPIAWTLRAGILTNEADLYRHDGEIRTHGDPTEAALLVAATRLGLEPAEVRAEYPPVEELPFEPERQYSASVRRGGRDYLLFVKGAPERVLGMSTHAQSDSGHVRLDRAAVLETAREMAARGLRVLGLAYRVLPGAPAGGVVPPPEALTFLGLQGMWDPPRAGVREAIRGCQQAGIRVTMITGDHADTARAISTQLAIAAGGDQPLTGADIDRLDDDELRRRVRQVSVFARVAPEHKLRIVQAMRSGGEVVAVTGDGVNDAPALKAADIGIAMGRSGTDVAREAADMVLADDNFVSIYAAVEEGRVTFDNLRKVTFFLVSTGAAEVIMILTALGAGWPLPLVAAQILWLNLVTNGLQDVALAFEPGEAGVRHRPPRPRTEGVMSRLLWERTLVTGLVMAAGTLTLFRWELDQTGSLARAQTVALTTMVLFQMFHVGNCRSDTLSAFRKSPVSNPFLFVATAVAFLVHAAALYVPAAQVILRVEPIEGAAWVRMVAVAASIIVAIELHKLVRRRAAGDRPRADRAALDAGTRRAFL
ncbi:MAG: HAD-IC family P-type ATPase [Acidobacteria bacterium]|nr:HAD-IC family P-type ATPase [Acidobacteriota bacterium]